MAARKKPSVYSRALQEVQQAQQEQSDVQTSRQSDVLTAGQQFVTVERSYIVIVTEGQGDS